MGRDDVKRRFPKDLADPPVFYFKVKTNRFRWSEHADEHQQGLSVNCRQCIRNDVCSLHLDLHPNVHIVFLDLEALSQAIAMPLRAIFRPIETGDSVNPCHFNIVPEENDIRDVMRAVRDFMSDEFAEVVDKEESVILLVVEQYRKVFVDVIFDPLQRVLSKRSNGQLTSEDLVGQQNPTEKGS